MNIPYIPLTNTYYFDIILLLNGCETFNEKYNNYVKLRRGKCVRTIQVPCGFFIKVKSMQEIWKDVKGYEGYYQISNCGRLKSFKVNSKGKILKLTDKSGGYFTVILQGKGLKKRSTRIHRLVAEAFLPNPKNLSQVNHIDGNKQNNNVKNLEWCTASHNIRHSIKLHPEQITKMVYYNQHIRPKAVVQMDLKGNIIAEFENATVASQQTGVCARNILQMANKTPYKKDHLRKSAGGYKWAFKSEVM